MEKMKDIFWKTVCFFLDGRREDESAYEEDWIYDAFVDRKAVAAEEAEKRKKRRDACAAITVFVFIILTALFTLAVAWFGWN